MALLAYTHSRAVLGAGYCHGASSQILLYANLLFAFSTLSYAIGSHPNRFWLATCIVASILVFVQMTDSLPLGATSEFTKKFVLNVTPDYLHGSAGWLHSFAAEFASLLTYCWTPLLSLAFGSLAKSRSNASQIAG